MAKKPDRFPPLLVASGGQELLRRRFVAQVVTTQKAAGWTVLEVDGSVPTDVQDALDGDPFAPRETLAVVMDPEKIDLELLERHHTSKDYQTTLLLHIEGEPDGRTKFGKAVKASWASVHKSFPLPTDWQAPKVGAEFVQAEAVRLGFQFPADLAQVLVERSGTDLGLLSFEVQKITMLAGLDGAKTLGLKHVAGGIAPIAEASVFAISDALAVQQSRKLLKALQALKRTSKDDPTMRVCRVLGTSVTKWLQAISLDALPPKAAAEELGVNPWYFETKILPAARRWGKTGTVQLVADLAVAERAVLNGACDPWVVLSSRLLAACRGTR